VDLGVVVVSYNTRDLTRNCLTSVRDALAHKGLDGRVWVVDNGSADGSVEMLRSEFPDVRLLVSQENLGFARGNNLALEDIARLGAPPRYVLLLNSDTVVQPDALGHLVRFMDEHPAAGAAGARLVYGDGGFQHSAFRFPTLAMALLEFWPLNHRLTNSRLNGRYPRRLYEGGEPFAIDHPLGAALMARWEAIREVGFLDPAFFMYCEEVDWCLRLKQAGWSVYTVPQAVITHLEGASAKQFREAMFVALWRSRFLLFDKHYSALYRCLARRIVRAGMRKEIRNVRRQVADGVLDRDGAERRIAAYRQVMEL